MSLDGEVGNTDAVMAAVLLDAEAITDSVVSMGEGRGEARAAGGEGAALAEAVLHLDVEAGQLVVDLGALEIHLELVLELSVLGQEHPLLLLLLGVEVVLEGKVHPAGDPDPRGRSLTGILANLCSW